MNSVVKKSIEELTDTELIDLTKNMIRNLNGMDKRDQPHYSKYKARTTVVCAIYINRFGGRALETLMNQI